MSPRPWWGDGPASGRPIEDAPRAGRVRALLLATVVVLGVAALLFRWAFGTGDAPGEIRATVSAAAAIAGPDTAGYARAIEPRTFRFPEDYGPHPEYRTEWWYLTGNLRHPPTGRRFAYQLTFFRNALRPDRLARRSVWNTNQLWMAHLAITDVASGVHVFEEKFARGAAGLAGGDRNPFRVWLESWEIRGATEEPFPLQVRADLGAWGLDLVLEEGKPPVLQGEGGLSRKGPDAGNASYYVSLTRVPTRGTLTIDGIGFGVEGTSWMDREWSTSALDEQHVGWDWFSLQLDDNREIMFFELRRRDGTTDTLGHGALVDPDGSYRVLRADEVDLTVLGRWPSPLDGVEYPSGWRMQIPAAEVDVTIMPMVPDQEMNVSVRYWEGAVQVDGHGPDGPVTGVGFAELTGYDEARDEGGTGGIGSR